MKTYACNLLWALSLGTIASSAAPLSPQEAYNAATAHYGSGRMKVQGSSMQLTYTVNDSVNNSPTLYIFTASQGSPGFLIAAADDAVHPLVGYSDSAVFDPDNIPPAMREWMDNCSEQVAEASSNAVRSYAAAVSRAPIAPLVSARWNQDSPYNNMCPVYNDQNCVTGCVATAMAQIMKYHNWPLKGVGSKTYSYITQAGSASTLTLNYASIAFDWDNMADTYSALSSEESQAAVAQLMYACGVGAEMKYSTLGSGANSYTAGRSMVDNFNYDRSIVYLERDWFDASAWNDLIYAELEAGRPVLYCGVSSTNIGHAFVCDGYSSDEYFHINWGWGGICDGYFRLELLDPGQEQGIGGSNQGYAFHQSVLIGIRPQTNGSAAPCMVLNSNLSTSAASYARTSSTPVGFTGGFYSYALSNTKVYLGVKCVNATDTVVVLYQTSAKSLDPNYGLAKMSISATKFPVGEYNVWPVYRTSTSDPWVDMLYDRTSVSNKLHLSVTDSTITVSEAVEETEPVVEEPTEVTAEFDGFGAERSSIVEFNPNHTYTASFTVSIKHLPKDATWAQSLYCLLLDSDGIVLGENNPQTVGFDTDGSAKMQWEVKVPYLITPGGYSMALAYLSDNQYNFISADVPVTITYSEEEGYAIVEGASSVGGLAGGDANSLSTPMVLDNKYGGICVTLYCPEGPWTDNNICGAIYDSNNQLMSYTTSQCVSIDEYGMANVVFYVGSESDFMEANSSKKAPQRVKSKVIALASNTTYALMPWSETRGALAESPTYFVLNDMIPTGVNSINADSREAVYYNLRGERMAADNLPSGIFIKVQGGHVNKIAIK